MTFAAPLALVGAGLVALPILIHWLGRGRSRVVRFPSLRFINPSRVPPLTRARIEDAGLLALRAATITLAAIALAQPRSTTRTAAFGNGPERIAPTSRAVKATRIGPAVSFDSLVHPPAGDVASARAAVRLLDDPVVRGIWTLRTVGDAPAAELDAAVASRGRLVAPAASVAERRIDSLPPPSTGDDDGSPFVGRWAWIAALMLFAIEGIVRRRRPSA